MLMRCRFERMKNKYSLPLLGFLSVAILAGCDKEDDPTEISTGQSGPDLVLRFQFDSTQVRLDNLGQPATMTLGNAAQSPIFNSMSAHYVEFTPDQFTPLGNGDVVYTAPETTAGGSTAIDFDQATFAGDNEEFLRVPLSTLSPSTYEWLRVSLAYQNFDISVRVNAPLQLDLSATLAGFIGYNTYINQFQVKDSMLQVYEDKLQGFWAVETQFSTDTGSAPPGATTVPNPIFANSPIPQGSCVVTGEFSTPLSITGAETSDVVIDVFLSTNKSFEWIDDGDGLYEPLDGDQLVDMGIRGMIPIVQ